jgi:DNA-binding transcriptional LysR family regulator
MELREIEIFLTLAEELHFGRTAQRLFVSQSRVSQTVRTLEARAGGQLFERTSRHVRLTALGERLRDLVRPSYHDLHEAFRVVSASTAAIAGELRVAFGTLPVLGPSFGHIITEFQAAHPACRITLLEMTANEGLDGLRGGLVDAMVSWLPLDQPFIVVGPLLSRQQRALAVPVGHPLVQRAFATIEDLADLSIMDVRGLPDETLAAFNPRRTPSGRQIPRSRSVERLTEGFPVVASGAAGHLTVESMGDYYRHPGVALLPLRGLPPIASALVWSAARQTPAVTALAEVARRFQHL